MNSKPQVGHIIIVGSQRSGTTLMGQILGSHPRALLLDEDDGVYEWVDSVLSAGPHRVTQRLFRRSCRRARRRYVRPTTRVGLMGGLRAHIDKVTLKAPNLTHRHSEIARTLPSSKIVYMLRDARDVVASMLRLAEVPILANQLSYLRSSPHVIRDFSEDLAVATDEGMSTIQRLAAIAKIKMSLASYFEAANLAVRTVQYEELVSDPVVTCQRIAEHVGLAASDTLLHHAATLRGTAPGGTQRARTIDTRSIGAWRKRLTAEQAHAVEAIAPDLCGAADGHGSPSS